MTVEELNVRITANADGFRSEIALVNSSLEELRKKMRSAAVEATAAFSGMMDIVAEQEKAEAVPASAEANVGSTEKSGLYTSVPSYLRTMVPAARVQSLRRGETVIGAISDGAGQSAAAGQPIQINTTVELDGDVIGESVSLFDARKRKMLND